ncbi:hypothetical protein [Paraburkholderia atlantica]|uniref:hypothetical protein n=1 Tax=Paraburkholderia atlantica TaxID=2654982 RepID=UPI0016193B7E|nr:hypothetical protein [Paraburkholderia atlantica]MBB5506713.1 hypothetical protein [Paraburkholderia atlantica]
MNNQPTTAHGGEATVWAQLDDAKKLYEAYLQVNATSTLMDTFSTVSSHVQVSEEFPPLTLTLYR